MCGLPVDNPKFSTLPPYFKADVGDQVDSIVRDYFPGLPVKLEAVCRFALASVVYHSQFLREHIPANHALWHCSLFCQPQVLNLLRENVVCNRAGVTDIIQPTGIPPHIQVLVEHQKTQSLLQELPSVLMGSMQNLLEQRDVAAGNITPDAIQRIFQQSINQAFSEHGLGEYNRHREQQPQQQQPQVEELQRPEQPWRFQWHHWGGRFHPVPENFTIPSLNVQAIWRLWMCGNEVQNIPPLRMLIPPDLNKMERNKLSRLKVPMNLLEEEARTLDCWVDSHRTQVTIAKATAMFEGARSVLPDPPVSRRHYQRRVGEVTWRTMTNLIRQKRKADELESNSREAQQPQPPSQRPRID